MPREFIYRAKIEGITDGDTMKMTIDKGFRDFRYNETIRLLRVDTHEIHFVRHDSEEYERGMEEFQFVARWVREKEEAFRGKYPFILDTYKDDERGDYERYLGDVISRADGEKLNDILLETFEGVEYNHGN